MRSYLGQNFLINKIKIKEIIDVLELKAGDVVIEIGPGHGELTEELRIKNDELKIIAIEKDKLLAQELSKNFQFSIFNFQSNSKFQFQNNKIIIIGDALKLLPQITNNKKLITNNYKLIGNIPYYITGHLLRIIGELENKPELIVLTVQKEVAERICVKPPKMNLLAASVQFWAKPEIVGYIPKKDFNPVPDVDGAIIRLTTYDRRLTTNETEKYYKLIKILFKQPRKTIINNLIYGFQNLTKAEIIERLIKLKINPEARPQDLDVKNITDLSELIYQ